MQSESTTFVPQHFERREVGKTIKSSKKQFIWRMQLNNKEVNIELFTSKISGKKKILVGGKVIYEVKKHKDTFTYPFKVGKTTIYMVETGSDIFDLRIDNKSFDQEFRMQKQTSQFDWNNRKKHDAFEVRDFGTNLDKVYQPTTREGNLPKTYTQSNIDRDEPTVSQKQEHQEVLRARQKKARTEQRQQEQEDNLDFDGGFDHGFEQLGTFQGGTDDHVTATVDQKDVSNQNNYDNSAQNQSNDQNASDFNFDFNDSSNTNSNSATNTNTNQAKNIDDLLDLSTNTNQIPKQEQLPNVFDLNNLNTNNVNFQQPNNNNNSVNYNQQSSSNQASNSFDPFSTNQTQQKPEEAKFVPKPMETYQTQQQQQMMQQAMMQQMMMQQMQQQQQQQYMQTSQMQQQNQFQTSYSNNNNQFMTQQQQQPQFFNSQAQPNQQQQNQQTSQNSSTPFDVFSM